jgi:quinolinate synthase
MAEIAEQHDELIVGTERGLIDRLQQRFPEKTWCRSPAPPSAAT